jgi:hypothetical protein
MEAWSIFTRALRSVADHLDVALRLSLLPYGLVAAAQLLVLSAGGGALPVDPAALPPPTDVDPAAGGADLLALMGDPRLVWTSLLSVVLFVLAMLWIAVGWHRFALLGEVPHGWVPPLHGARMLGYLGRTILLSLLVAAAVIVASIPLGLLGAVLGGAGVLLASAAGLVLAMVVFYRLSVILPAGAAERPIGLREAWAATAGRSGTAVGLAMLTFGFSLLLQIPTLLDASMGAAAPVITTLYQIAIGWIGLLVGVAVLTVFYARTEGRASGDGHA